MDSLFRQSQSILNSLQSKIKIKLELIQTLDKKALQLQVLLEEQRENLINHINYQNSIQNTYSPQQSNIQFQKVTKLQDLLRQTINSKIQMAQELQKIVTQTCYYIDKQICDTAQAITKDDDLKIKIKLQHMFLYGLRKQKGRQKNVRPQIKEIIKDYYDEKQSQNTTMSIDQKYCSCSTEAKILFPQAMIQCQNQKCKIGWFHLQCVKVNVNNIPNNWFCPSCEKTILKSQKYVKKLSDEKKQQKVNWEIKQKRGRGRPRKVILS